jgi:cytochrome c peroxidase
MVFVQDRLVHRPRKGGIYFRRGWRVGATHGKDLGKIFTLRGIKDSPPYLHDGRCLTLEDTIELFSLVLGLQLAPQEQRDLVAFMKQHR